MSVDVPLIAAIDQGTSSSRFLVFSSKTAQLVTFAQVEIRSIFPQHGWVEMDPLEILDSVERCISKAVENLRNLGLDPSNIVAVGISNQRETTIVWDKSSGKPLYNAIVWLDQRTAQLAEALSKSDSEVQRVRKLCGLPIHPYFSALKMKWLIDHIPVVREAITHKQCLAGTVDSWLIWNLTKGLHVTDVTNASRTMLMNLETLQWDASLLQFFSVPADILPAIRTSSEIYGKVEDGPLAGVAISGCLGDQQAALLGQGCFSQCAKCTYGTGCFLLYNTGTAPIISKHGLLTTVAYKLGHKPAHYALEGSIAVAGACIQWLRDHLQIIQHSSEIEEVALQVDGTHGVVFVPAFSGLFAPHWRPDARGIICGLSQYSSKPHIARAALEAVCFQTREVMDAMVEDLIGFAGRISPSLQQNNNKRQSHSGIEQFLQTLKVDGGMTVNNLLMQMQADLLGIPVTRPDAVEASGLGAAIAAGAASGIEVLNVGEFLKLSTAAKAVKVFDPQISEFERNQRFHRWNEGVKRSLGWIDDKTAEKKSSSNSFKASSLMITVSAITSIALVFLVAFMRHKS